MWLVKDKYSQEIINWYPGSWSKSEVEDAVENLGISLDDVDIEYVRSEYEY